jgi:predicted outer membrane protein
MTNTELAPDRAPRKEVYACIAAVTKELAKAGISKDKRNEQQNYRFRGIDDVYNALAPILAGTGLVILPRMVGRSVTERHTSKGAVLFYVVVDAEFDFVAASDGSVHTVKTYGEAMDSGDKATNKAMSAAYKYAAFQTFCIPTEGTPDANATTHEVAAPLPEGFQDWLTDLEAIALEGTERLKETWKASPPEFRRLLTQRDKPLIDRLKATAAQHEQVPA